MFRLVMNILFWVAVGTAGTVMFGTVALCGWEAIMSGNVLNTGEVAHPVLFTWWVALSSTALTAALILVAVHGVAEGVRYYKFCVKHNLVY